MHSQTTSPNAASELGGTSWQLVKFQGGGDTTLVPDEPAKYTVEFQGDGSVNIRIDCNRGRGTWKSAGAGQVEFGPLALTRAMCPAEALSERLPKDWQNLRSYALKDGHLFLALMADGGIYEYEPMSRRVTGNVAETTAPEATIPGLPATFAGTLPCADCPGINYHINLFPDHTFLSRMTYEGRTTRFDDRGRWQLAGAGRTMVLEGGRGETTRFSVLDANTLRKLDNAGREIVSQLNYDLKRTPAFMPIESPGQETAPASLENTYWTLTRLRDARISAASGKQEPHIVLDRETHRVRGAGGCNRLTGSYRVVGDRITFTQMAATLMACLEGMDTEKSFLDALKDVSTWRITGGHLELFDASGKLLASFESRQIPSSPD
jgi:heat shock protein HslJ